MFTRPVSLNDDDVLTTLRRCWGLAVDNVEYRALGFGSHHWHAVGDGTQWFVTVDDLDARRRHESDSRLIATRRLNTALSAAYVLQRQGMAFVVGPILSRSGLVLENVDDRYVLALYPYLEGRHGTGGHYDVQAERFAVVDCLIDIHGATGAVKSVIGVEDFDIPGRDQLTVALDEMSTPLFSGPYAERACALLARHSGELITALRHYDDLVGCVQRSCGDMVVTHGEPHRGNVVFTEHGASLIDDDALRLYRLWWDLCEIPLYIDEFRRSHIDSVDTRTAWQGLVKYLDPRRWVGFA